MKQTLGRRRLGEGTHTLPFEGVVVGMRVSGKSATAPLIWTWGNGDSVIEIASSQNPALGNVGGDLLAVLVDAKVGQEVDVSLAVGKSCTIVVKDIGLRQRVHHHGGRRTQPSATAGSSSERMSLQMSVSFWLLRWADSLVAVGSPGLFLEGDLVMSNDFDFERFQRASEKWVPLLRVLADDELTAVAIGLAYMMLVPVWYDKDQLETIVDQSISG